MDGDSQITEEDTRDLEEDWNFSYLIAINLTHKSEAY